MRKKFLFIFLIFLVNSIFSYSSIKAATDEELQKVFDKNKEKEPLYKNVQTVESQTPIRRTRVEAVEQRIENLNDDDDSDEGSKYELPPFLRDKNF